MKSETIPVVVAFLSCIVWQWLVFTGRMERAVLWLRSVNDQSPVLTWQWPFLRRLR